MSAWNEFTAVFGQELKRAQQQTFWEGTAFAAFVAGIVVVVAYAVGAAAWWRPAFTLAGVLLLIALAAWLSGSLVGFLFGVPRFRAEANTASAEQQVLARYLPNTNLEQISDWLTKIIIGATLVQVQSLPLHFQYLCDGTAQKLGQPGLAPVIGAVIIFFGFTGFLWCYLWSSIRVLRALAHIAQEGDGPDLAAPPTPKVGS